MAYAEHSDYSAIYPDGADETTFDRLVWEASRIMDVYTTGADNVRKLQEAAPTDDYGSEAVKRCACALVDVLYRIGVIEDAAVSSAGIVTRGDGTVVGKQISSMSSGSESVSYAVSTAAGSVVGVAASDAEARKKLIASTIKTYLSGVEDANGVNLLYMGVYPYVL